MYKLRRCSVLDARKLWRASFDACVDGFDVRGKAWYFEMNGQIKKMRKDQQSAGSWKSGVYIPGPQMWLARDRTKPAKMDWRLNMRPTARHMSHRPRERADT